jgi:hypothetical protein
MRLEQGRQMQEIDILYFVEHAARELDIACAAKYLLEQRHGLSVEIVSIFERLEEALDTWQPQVVAIPYCTSVKDWGLESMVTRWPHARFVNLAFEQILGKTQKAFKAPKDDFSRHYVLQSVWGDFFGDYLRSHGVIDELVVVNGNPNFPLYQSPYRAYFGSAREKLAEKFGLDMGRRWVFVPENYGWAFFRNHMIRDRIRRGFNPDDAYRYRDFARDSLHEAARWWYQAAGLDNLELIVRPRPAIPAEHFIAVVQEVVGEIPEHLHFIKYATVREWILASDLVFSSYSTTLLDAAVAHKPLYMLMPYTFPDFLYAEWYDLAAKVKTGAAFIEAVSGDTLDSNWEPLETWVKRTMMFHGDAIGNLVRLLASVKSGEIAVPQPFEIAREAQRLSLDKVKRKGRRFGWNLWQNGLARIGIKTLDQVWDAHEEDLITPANITKRVSRWAEVLGG